MLRTLKNFLVVVLGEVRGELMNSTEMQLPACVMRKMQGKS
jgi:hypothetical protein